MLLGVPFANAIYKKVPGHNVFKILLYLPHVLSMVVMSTIFMNFTEEALPQIMLDFFKVEWVTGPLSNRSPTIIFNTVMFFTIFMGFGSNMLMYTGAMSGISESLKEAAKIDGANSFQEFIHITIPSIWPTMCTLIVVGFTGVFTNQLNMFTFYGDGAPIQVSSLGYYLYKYTYKANGLSNPYLHFPYLAAFGLVLTMIAAPLTIGLRKLLENVGPNTK